MTMKRSAELVREGSTEVFVLQQKRSRKGPGARLGEPFYNPAMELSRDLSVLVNQWFVRTRKESVCLLDGLGASGIRGVRYGHEIVGDFNVTINDSDVQAHSLIRKNIAHNALKNVEASNKDLNVLLSENKFDSIDIDPFGSPVFFIDSALRSIRHNGLLACTATDTAPLCGVYPLVCLRRYGAWPFHSPMMHEIGLRILLGFLCREAGKFDKGIEPLLCHASDYYFRVYVQVKKGKEAANRSVEQLSCFSAKDLSAFSHRRVSDGTVGPLWMGKLQKRQVVEQVRSGVFEKQLNTKHELWKLVQTLEEEAGGPPFFYTMEDVATKLKTSVPRREHFFDKLREEGFLVTRTHCTPTGFKTNASFEEIKRVFRSVLVS